MPHIRIPTLHGQVERGGGREQNFDFFPPEDAYKATSPPVNAFFGKFSNKLSESIKAPNKPMQKIINKKCY